jgi:hypothetical protein
MELINTLQAETIHVERTGLTLSDGISAIIQISPGRVSMLKAFTTTEERPR